MLYTKWNWDDAKEVWQEEAKVIHWMKQRKCLNKKKPPSGGFTH
jgi:uncharacterized protein (DUF2384 family)